MTSEMTSEMARIYVGGLGERVTKDDVINTFSKLGKVESVDIINTKGRSFAYINFYPSSQNALAKLFSTYNGCMWKGGKLKLEKAREHYLGRLKREWEEDDKASSIPQNDRVVDEDVVGSPKLKCSLDLDKEQIRMYFPKLRKIKSLPLRGTGKHKYSFQRLEVPPRPRHFCDCPEHSNPVETQEKISRNSMKKRGFDRNSSSGLRNIEFPVQEQLQESIIQDDGMNEEEISIMNSVMKRILDRGTSKAEQVGRKDLLQQNASASCFPVANEVEDGRDDSSDDDDDDDDDIMINVSSKFKRVGRHELPQSNLSAAGFPVDMNEIEDETKEDDDDDDEDIMINVTSKVERMERRELLQKNLHASGFPVDLNQVEDVTEEDDDIKINATSKKIEWAGRLDLPQQNAHAFGSSTEANGISDDGQDDDNNDDIEINVMSGQNKGSNSESQELETSFDSERARLNELLCNDDLSSRLDSQTREKKDKVCVRKRKSLANENDEKKRASPSSKKKARSPSNMSTKAGTEESNAQKGTVSQKSTWKELISDSLTNPFSLAQVTSNNETSSESEEHEGVETSSDSEEHEGVETSSDSEEHEGVDPSSDREEHEGAENDVNENTDDKSTQSGDKDRVFEAQTDKPRTEPDKSTKGSSWMQKGSWTQLIGGGNSSLFSISQTMPTNQLEKCDQKHQSGASKAVFGNPRGPFGSNNAARDAADISNKMTVDKKSDSKHKPTLPPRSYPKAGSGDSCPFMRNADSLKEWTSAKTALSSALKRRNDKA